MGISVLYLVMPVLFMCQFERRYGIIFIRILISIDEGLSKQSRFIGFSGALYLKPFELYNKYYTAYISPSKQVSMFS